MEDIWVKVDRYLEDTLLPEDAVLRGAIRRSEAEGLPRIQVTPPLGRLIQLLARLQGARRILEVGTLGGYSTIWLARALPAGGRLVTVELSPHHAEVARQNIVAAGLQEVVEVRVGAAGDVLRRMWEAGESAYDMVFIDADKASLPEYLTWALRLTRPGSLIVADNVVRRGAVVDAASEDANVRGVRAFLAACGAEPRLEATVLQTVGAKGHDGIAVALVVDSAGAAEGGAADD